MFLDAYPPAVSEIASLLRVFVRRVIPDAVETLDAPSRIVGYAIGEGYLGLVCTIIPGKTGVKLGIVRAVELPDPMHLLEGTGRRHRYIQFNEPADLDRPGIDSLVLAAHIAARPKRR